MPQFVHLACNCLYRPDKAGIIVAIDRNIDILDRNIDILDKKNDSMSKHEIKEFIRIKEKVENTPDCK